jgi:hypothetical protein
VPRTKQSLGKPFASGATIFQTIDFATYFFSSGFRKRCRTTLKNGLLDVFRERVSRRIDNFETSVLRQDKHLSHKLGWRAASGKRQAASGKRQAARDKGQGA